MEPRKNRGRRMGKHSKRSAAQLIRALHTHKNPVKRFERIGRRVVEKLSTLWEYQTELAQNPFTMPELKFMHRHLTTLHEVLKSRPGREAGIAQVEKELELVNDAYQAKFHQKLPEDST